MYEMHEEAEIAKEMQGLDAQHNTTEDGHNAQKCGEEMLFSVNGDCLWRFYFILAISCCALSVTT